ncbi:hypothetical protein CHU92_12830 [Flavobacterium cyanobacteriorum]|uniref:Uncharacterized protein n=1 Tax=Flavobacterium cyanobacteriorum TaxID=2022802 RepID=A0A255YVR9_9FLAO|nr:hypothetical protein [Flavobacterium cyanobacteriorum]OYQ33271.1 hypothetical protein CHU92_12830 [Flavobacterium cyanobacteriorum]
MGLLHKITYVSSGIFFSKKIKSPNLHPLVGGNVHAVAGLNPLKNIDPSGEEFISLTAVVVGAIISMTAYTITALHADVPFTAAGL